MIGFDASTGKAINGDTHLRQSIERILFTPLNSVVMRPDFGSRLVELLGHALVDNTRLQIFVAIAEALAKWEKRIDLKRVEIEANSQGVAEIYLTYDHNETGQKNIKHAVKEGVK